MSSAPLIFQASPSYFPRETRLSATHCSRSVYQGSSTPITERRRTIPLEYLQQFRYSTVSRRMRREAIGAVGGDNVEEAEMRSPVLWAGESFLRPRPAAPLAVAPAPGRSVECEFDGIASGSAAFRDSCGSLGLTQKQLLIGSWTSIINECCLGKAASEDLTASRSCNHCHVTDVLTTDVLATAPAFRSMVL